MRTFPLALLLLAGCADSDVPPGSPPDARPAREVVIDASAEDDACAVLTPALVSEVAGAPADAEGIGLMRGTCTYTWGEPESSATLSQLRVYDDAEQARRFFAQATATMTRGDYRRGMEAIGDQVERQREAGELSDPEADGAGALADGLGDAVAEGEEDEVISAFAPVAGVGDEAAI